MSDTPPDTVEPTSGTGMSDKELNEILSQLTDLQKKYCQIKVLQKPGSNSKALEMAGSNADPKYLSKMAWEMEQYPHVQAYLNHLRSVVVEEVGIELQEIVHNARKAIEIAFMNNKPRDAEPHNRLLAELAGYIGSNSGAHHHQSQTNVTVNTDSSLREDSIEADFQRLQDIVSSD